MPLARIRLPAREHKSPAQVPVRARHLLSKAPRAAVRLGHVAADGAPDASERDGEGWGGGRRGGEVCGRRSSRVRVRPGETMCGEQEETRRTDDLDVFGFESHAAKLDWAAQGAQKGDDVPLDPVARLSLCRRRVVDAVFLDTSL